MYYYMVTFDHRVDHSERGEGDYADWSESCTNTFDCIEQFASESHKTCKSTVNLSVQDGWLVWVETSSGDSFGHGTRTGADAIGVFATKEAALQCAEAISETAKDRGVSAFLFKSPDGQTIELGFAPWADYFGGLDEVHVQRVNLHTHGPGTIKDDNKITVHD